MDRFRLTVANLRAIGKHGQARISGSTFAIAGLGGVGGVAFDLLLRAGVKEIRIADFGFFEESNANRQLLWTRETNALSKEIAAMRLASTLNPECGIVRFGKITPQNARGFAKGCAAVIDCTDSPKARKDIFRGCASERVPCIYASALGAKGMLTVFAKKSLGEKFPFPVEKAPRSCDHALGPVSNAIGCLAAQQAINIAVKKPIIKFPRIFSLDAFSHEPALVHEF